MTTQTENLPVLPAKSRSRRLAADWKLFVSVPCVVWVALWFGLNTGTWALSVPELGDLVGWLNYSRTLGPLFIVFLPLIVARVDRRRPPLSGPLLLWLLYGLLVAIASAASRFPEEALYWAANYVAAFSGTVVFLAGDDPLARARRLNQLTWAVALGFLLILVYFAKDFLLSASGSAYGIEQVENPTGAAMSRSSGVARFAAVPGLVGFSWILAGGPRRAIAGAVAFLGSAILIGFLQSRGAIFAFLFAISFATMYFSQRTRTLGLVGAVLSATLVMGDVVSPEWVDRAMSYIRRGQTAAEFRTFTGRTRAWDSAWAQFVDSPVFGFGHQADRFLISEHVHNTYLYAMLAGGAVGVLLFSLGLVWAWRIFFRAHLVAQTMSKDYRMTVVQTGSVLAFFTVRGFVEVSGASFSVDTMLMVPAIAFLTVLAQRNPDGASTSFRT